MSLGVGDDAALLNIPPGQQLVVTTDILVSGVHFLPDVDPVSLGHKALAVNLSDLAAMGADPAWFTLNLVLPEPDEDWLRGFCDGLYALARRYEIQLVGGDTSRGPLAVAIHACGFVPRGQALTRAGAKPGDRIFVTGTLGDAALALAHSLGERKLPQADFAAVQDRLDRPMPRIEQGRALRGVATAAIDISDGLVADLGHILEASGVAAEIRLDRIPLSPVYRSHLPVLGWEGALAVGDDYELCFTLPPRVAPPCDATEIGAVTAGAGLTIRDADGRAWKPAARGHDHFAGS